MSSVVMRSPLWNLTSFLTLKRSVFSSGYDQAVAMCGLTLPFGSRNTSGSAMWIEGFRLASDCSMFALRVVIGSCWMIVTWPVGPAAAAGFAAGAWVAGAAGAAVACVCGATAAAMVGAA